MYKRRSNEVEKKKKTVKARESFQLLYYNLRRIISFAKYSIKADESCKIQFSSMTRYASLCVCIVTTFTLMSYYEPLRYYYIYVNKSKIE